MLTPKNSYTSFLQRKPTTNDIEATLLIKDLQNNIKDITINLSEDVDNLISAISLAKGINQEQIKLIFKGLELKNGEKLDKYDLYSGCEIFMLKRLKKPVILFYNFTPNEKLIVEVKLNPDLWQLDKAYPRPLSQDSGNIIWEMTYLKDNSLMVLNKHYPYLYWDANIIDNKYLIESNLMQKFFCCVSEAVEDRLDDVLEAKGLNALERFDLITFWLPELKVKKYLKFSFLEAKLYDKLAEMNITPKPNKLLRVILLFVPLDEIEEDNICISDIHKFERNNIDSTVIEWGGINLLNIK
jgi:hypothetical protein